MFRYIPSISNLCRFPRFRCLSSRVLDYYTHLCDILKRMCKIVEWGLIWLRIVSSHRPAVALSSLLRNYEGFDWLWALSSYVLNNRSLLLPFATSARELQLKLAMRIHKRGIFQFSIGTLHPHAPVWNKWNNPWCITGEITSHINVGYPGVHVMKNLITRWATSTHTQGGLRFSTLLQTSLHL